LLLRAAYRTGIEYPVDNFLQQLESRLDNFVWRVGLAPTMAGARHFVKEGHIQWKNGTTMNRFRTVNVPSMLLKIGDEVRVNRKNKASQNYGRLNLESEPTVAIPAHITWDKEEMTGSYNDICDRFDFGLNVEERFITCYYSGGVLIMDPARIVKHYLRTWFPLDLLLFRSNPTSVLFKPCSNMAEEEL